MRRPFRALCPEADMRDAMDDAEFWAHVFGQDIAADDISWDDEPTAQLTACRVCGEFGPCGYDAEGKPMIHTTEPEDG
jgi:hypothetical protein